MNTQTTVVALQKVAVWGTLFLLPLVFFGIVSAEASEGLSVSTNGMTATVSFTRPTPCSAYELDWDDGEEDAVEEIDEICIQVLEEKTLRHTYEDEGEYTVTLTQSGESHTETIEVPGEELLFGLEDVASITSKWVDPFEMMADEEYYIYTITLESGGVVTVEAGGFTTVEYRNKQFTDAGYTGDVTELLAMIEENASEDKEPTEPEGDSGGSLTLYHELITALETLIKNMQQLLSLRGQ